MVKLTQDALTLHTTSTRYKLSLLALSPLVFAHALYRTFKDGGIRYFKQRIGFGYKTFNNKPIHFHCASVGEYIAAKPLILSIHDSFPDKNILITTNTPTAASLVDKLDHQNIDHHYLPLDFAFSIKQFFKKTKPLCCFILETEIWPTFYAQSKKNNISIAIINARLSDKTLNTNKFIKNEYARTLKNVTLILARSKDDSQKYLNLGANKNTLHVLGNLKYSVTETEDEQLACTTIKRPFFLAASTHEDEESQIVQHLEIFKRKNYLLVLAPRYPERCEQLAKQFRDLKYEVAIRSQHDNINSTTDIYLVDTLGELNMYFNEAALVFVGGSLVPRGGQNVLEPARFGKCVLVGPHTDNFSNEVNELLRQEAIVQVQDNHQLGVQLISLLKNDQHREQIGKNAATFMNKQTNILNRYHDCIKTIIEQSVS